MPRRSLACRGMGSQQWNEGGRHGNQPSQARCCTYCVLCKHQLAQTDRPDPPRSCKLILGCHPCGAFWVVGEPRIECNAVHRDVAHFAHACSLGGNLLPCLSLLGSFACPRSVRPSQSRPCASEGFASGLTHHEATAALLAWWSHIEGGWNFVFSESPRLLTPGPWSKRPARLEKQTASYGWVAPGSSDRAGRALDPSS